MTEVPQLSLRAILLSIALTVVLSAANAYLGLFAGLTVATAIPAAVVSMGVLRLLGRSSVLENNIVATGASAGSSIAAGTVFTMPALILLGALLALSLAVYRAIWRRELVTAPVPPTVTMCCARVSTKPDNTDTPSHATVQTQT